MADSVFAAVHLDLLGPLSGIMVSLEPVPDPVFPGKLVGDGTSLDPTPSELLPPVAGAMTQLAAVGGHHRSARAPADPGRMASKTLAAAGVQVVMTLPDNQRDLSVELEAAALAMVLAP